MGMAMLFCFAKCKLAPLMALARLDEIGIRRLHFPES